MITVPHGRYQLCDGIARRSFLSIGGLALGGLSLPQVLKADAARRGASHKSVIMVFLTGAATSSGHGRPEAERSREYRGEFSPISTNVPGIYVCEHLPNSPQRMDQIGRYPHLDRFRRSA